jgi:HAD superfamily hydrolase (TIGR01509 family)
VIGEDRVTIQAVFFDMGGTIETCSHDGDLRLRATPELRRKMRAAGVDPGLEIEELCQVVTAGLARYKRWLAAVAQDLAFYVDTRYFHRQMHPEMPRVVEAIRQMGLRIGVISNILSHEQVPRCLDEYGLLPYFDPIVLSSVYGRRKPDPAIFHHAASRMGVPTSACIYIGDRVARDILGARRAGYGAALLVRHDFDHGESDDGPAPDLVLQNIGEVIPVLEEERSKPHWSPDMRAGSAVRAILFDAGDILYHRPQEGERFKRFLDSLGLALPADFGTKEEELKASAFRGAMSQESYREELVRFCGVEEPVRIRQGIRILEDEGNGVKFFDGVRDTLAALKERGFLLGIVTDTAHSVSTKLSWFESAGIGHVWDAFVSSLEAGVCKPDPRIYQAALRQLGVCPRETVFVGHKASELEGAKAVGLTTIAFNRDPGAQGDIHIERFSELLEAPQLAV